MARRRRQTKVEKDNYQDEFAEREFAKGERAGRGRKGKQSTKFSGTLTPNPNMNDPQWYFKDASVLSDAASFSFQKPLGYPIRYGDVVSTTQSQLLQIPSKSGYVPGLCSLVVSPTVGVSVGSQSPANLAATNMYSFVRHKNSGSRNYDSPDLMMYMLTMDSIYACWCWMKRLYGMASTYSQQNRYMPRAWFAANNVNYADVIDKLADFRYYLNVKADEISAFCIPATFTYNMRHAWLYSSIYTDSTTAKAQQYMYVPGYFYQYSETSSNKGGELVPVNVCYQNADGTFAAEQFTVAKLKQLLNTLLNYANYSEDIGIMSGDILKAYGDGALYKLGHIDADYKVEPVYSREVLTQIENAMVLPTTFYGIDSGYFKITQDPNTNWITSAPSVEITRGEAEPDIPYMPAQTGKILNFHWDSPTPQDVIVATRLNASYTVNADNARTMLFTVNSMGSEVCTSINVYAYAYSDSATAVRNISNQSTITAAHPLVSWMYNGFVMLPSQMTQIIEPLTSMQMIAAFDWGPTQYLYTYYQATGGVKVAILISTNCDYDVYTTLTDSNLESLNLLALLSEFNVPN